MIKFIKLLFLFVVFCLLFSTNVFAQQIYPQLDISGFKKWEYKKAEVTPTKNYFSGLTQLGGFYPTFTGGPWQERLRLKILGQLSKDLSVTYDLEQQPETPDKYDIKVKYLNNELTFGDFTANFSGNEFASASKFVNGVMLTAKDSWYDVVTVPSAKLKSQTQKLTTRKDINTKGPYNLGRAPIIEGSERIELNGEVLTRNVDYTIDYFEGKVTFTRILTQADEFKYSYEYTNILDLFFPSLSKRDFFGFQTRLTIDPEQFGQPVPKPEPIIDAVREAFPTSGTVEPEIIEEEASGRYKLKSTPVVRFSEKLTFMGTELKKNEDYIIRYIQGEIKLLTRFLPTTQEALIVEYKYYQSSMEVESISGIGSRGPYRLSYNNIIQESEKIEVDGKVFVRDLDYTIDYNTAEIIFGIVIGATSQIKVQYAYVVSVIPTLPPSKYPTQIKLGTTFLRESARAGKVEGTATTIDSATGQEIIDENYHLYLRNRPVTSEGLVIKVDGKLLTPEVDYIIPLKVLDPATGFYSTTPEAVLAFINDLADPSDGFRTGTIKFIKENIITSTSEVFVTYPYYTSVVSKYSGVGDGTRGPYYLRNIRNIVPGTETVQVWEQGSSLTTNYTRNSSIEPDAGDYGYAINYDADNPYLLFNKEIDTKKNFQIIYQYVPPSGFVSRDLSQSVFGFDGSFKIGDIFNVKTAYAKSEIDRAISKIATSESNIPGNGTKKYFLHSAGDIIEESESVFVNGELLNKDIDYFISYKKPGQINFYYITPTSLDTLRVDYDYQDPSAPVAEVKTKSDSAFRLGAETKLFGKVLTLSGKTKKVGFDFTPLGGTAIGAGSEFLEYKVGFKPDFYDHYTNYVYRENITPLSNRRDKFLRSYDNSVSTGINPWKLAKIALRYQKYTTMDDLLLPGDAHSRDTSQESYSISLTPAKWQKGKLELSQKYDLRETLTINDFLRDSNRYSEAKTSYRHAKGTLNITKRFSAGYDYQLSEPKTISLKHSTSEATAEAVSRHTRTIDKTYSFSADLTLGKIQKLTTRVSLKDHEQYTLARNFISTDEVLSTRNETYHVDFVPVKPLSTSYDRSRQEQTSVTAGGTNPKTERNTFSFRLTPYSWISANWNKSDSETFQKSGAKTLGKANTYSTTYTPISAARFKLSSTFTKSENVRNYLSPLSTTWETTNTDSLSQKYTLKVNPHPKVPITIGYTQRDYKNYKLSLTYPISTETQDQTLSASIAITPIPALQLSANYSSKITKDLLKKKESPKTVIGAKASYRIFKWGNLSIDFQNEDNKGEVQAGQLPKLDIKKTTITYGLNINIPVDNPVLSSFVVSAKLKSVDYKDRLTPNNDFTASLMTFEGTLNF
jgi:hypothetical protein